MSLSRLSSETDTGNIEYKLKLLNIDPTRFDQLVTQMRYRLSEGNGTCYYYIGVADDGTRSGITQQELDVTVENIKRMTTKNDANFEIVVKEIVSNGNYTAKLKISVDSDSYEYFGEFGNISSSTTITQDKFININIECQSIAANKLTCLLNDGCGEIVVKNSDYSINNFTQLLQSFCQQTDCDYTVLNDNYTFIYRIGKKEVNIAFIGNVDDGKSTTLGTLTSGNLDNGRGSSRQAIFTHNHERETGNTSDISYHLLGFTDSGEPIHTNTIRTSKTQSFTKTQSFSRTQGSSKIQNFHTQNHDIQNISFKKDWSVAVKTARKLVYLVDLAGHQKYLKSTIKGLHSLNLDYCAVMVDAKGLKGTTKEHISVCLSLGIRLFFVVSKIDMVQDTAIIYKTINQVKQLMQHDKVKKVVFHIKSRNDLYNLLSNYSSDKNCDTIPLFCISNVKGLGLKLLREFLNLVSSRVDRCIENTNYAELSMSVMSNFSIPGIGTVVHGYIHKGAAHKSQTVVIGPTLNGEFIETRIKTIHSKRETVETVGNHTTACFSLVNIKKSDLKSGMYVLSPDLNPKSYWGFEAKVIVLRHHTTVRPGYTPVIHVVNSNVAAKLISVTTHPSDTTSSNSEVAIRSGDRAIVVFKFIKSPAYIQPGLKILFREGYSKGTGIITRVIESF